jgi:predicted RNA binding protein YcfA (HicA-like mRNA interferase family)
MSTKKKGACFPQILMRWLLMPAKAKDLQKAAGKLGFRVVRQKGSHARWKHPDGRATTIPIHGNSEIGGWLLYAIHYDFEPQMP